MTSFDSLYGQKYGLLIVWFKISDVKPMGTDLVKESHKEVSFIQDKLLEFRS